jgi:hypothetical protein
MAEELPKMSLVKQGLLGKPMAPMLILAGVKGHASSDLGHLSCCLSKGDVPKTAWVNPMGGHLGRQVGVWPDPRIFKEVIIPWLVHVLEPEPATDKRQNDGDAYSRASRVCQDDPGSRRTPFYRVLWVQVLVAIALAIVLGYVDPARAIAMKPLGDAFIRMISMIITLIIFCTVVTGIAGMENLKKVGRVGGLALLYFEIVSTLALLIGLVVGNVVHPGSGFQR